MRSEHAFVASRLAIDTAGSEHGLVCLDGTRVLAQDRWPRSRGAGDPPILTRIQTLLRVAGRDLRDLEAIAAGRGPGSFTGLRVGLSVASGIAYGRGLPLCLIDSMAVLLAQAPAAQVALRDAGRGEAYAWRSGSDPVRLAGVALRAFLRPTDRVVVDPPGGLSAWWDAAGAEIPVGERRPFSQALAAAAIETFGSQKPVRYHEVQPLYVQPAAAEERSGSQ
jgi:tRNA threonylcarbamoyl adenosine modification protein YeaZ